MDGDLIQGWQKLSLADLAERVAKLPAKERDELVKEVYDATQSLKWIPNAGPQTLAYLSPADVLLYGGMAAGGKGTRKQSLVLTPFGWRKVGDLKVGSAICATDGTVQRIIGYHPRGEQPLFKLKWSDGSETVCDSDHIWLGWLSRDFRKIGNERVYGESSAAKWTAQMIYESFVGKPKSKRFRFSIPVMSAPAAFNVQGENHGPAKHVSRSVPSYILGVLLGDGSLTAGAVNFCSADQEIPNRVEMLLRGMGDESIAISRYASDKACQAYRIPTVILRDHLADLGLMGHGAATKFIPRIYLFAPTEERWELLRGLMDTDGWAEADGDCYFTSISKRLAEDVRHLARSLGAVVTWREKIPTYAHKGEKKHGARAYTLRIKMREPERMFFLERKRAICAGKEPQSLCLCLESIEPFGRDETVCISVSHPNSLYVIDDFIVTHNSDLILGLALTAHRRSLIIRQQYNDLDALTERLLVVNGTRQGFNGSNPPSLRTSDDRFIQFSGATLGQWAGHAFDLKACDEAAQMAQEVIRYHIGWLRSVVAGQRTRMVLASNPPVNSVGEWMIAMFRPWLDPTHPNPAKDGELRWYAKAPDGDDVEVEGPDPVLFPGQEKSIKPMSRTFIRARLQDNPYLVHTDYESRLDQMEEPYRSAMRDGNFLGARKDQTYQVIPTDWVLAAQKRWKNRPPKDAVMSAIAADVGAGGGDRVVVSARYGVWFAPLIAVKGKEAPDGSSQAALIARYRRNNCPVVIDMGGGYGGDVASIMKGNGTTVVRFNGAEGAITRTKDGTNRIFENKRAEAWWRLREALNPDQVGGSEIALPDDMELRSELTAPTYVPDTVKVQIESKVEVRKRLQRSPDKADAVVMAFSPGEAAARRQAARTGGGGRPARANLGYSDLKGNRS